MPNKYWLIDHVTPDGHFHNDWALVPPEMQAEKRWVLCRTKDEVLPDGSVRHAKSVIGKWKSPDTWMTFAEAVARAQKHHLYIGFVLGDGFTGIDLDHCLGDPEKRELVETVLAACPSYVEVSQSGTGLHIICRGKVKKALILHKTAGIEIYSKSRQFCITGRPYREPRPILDCQDGLDKLVAMYGQTIQVREKADTGHVSEGHRSNTIFALNMRMRRAGLPQDAIETAMLEYNRTHCDPPLPDEKVLMQCRDAYPEQNWHQGLLLTDKGAPQKCPGNVLAAFRHPDLEGVLAFDERFQEIVLITRPPWDRIGLEYPRAWTEADNVNALAWLPQLGPPINGSKGWVWDAAAAVGREVGFDPFRDWLDTLEWNGEPLLDRVLVDLCGAEDTTLNRVFFRKWLISAVARTYSPGCKADYMLVLVSEQGLKKSTFFSVLLPDFDRRLFREGLPKGHDKDTQIALQGPVLIEDGEMSHYGAREVASVKEFITRRDDKFRAPYDKTTESHPRRVVLCGSCNEQDFLHDDTGGRRFWPVEITEEIPVDTIAYIRDRLWAEARDRYRNGEQWWLTDAEEALAKVRQEAHREINPIEETLGMKLRSYVGDAGLPGYSIMPEQIEGGFIAWITVTQAIKLLELRISDKAAQIGVGKALRALGWEYGRRQTVTTCGTYYPIKKERVRIYRPPSDWEYEK